MSKVYSIYTMAWATWYMLRGGRGDVQLVDAGRRLLEEAKLQNHLGGGSFWEVEVTSCSAPERARWNVENYQGRQLGLSYVIVNHFLRERTTRAWVRRL